MQASNLIGRVKGILLTPRTEWPLIAAEPDTIAGIYTGYIMILAAIPALIRLISFRYLGLSVIPMVIATYVLALVGVFIVALIVELLAPTFGGQKDRVQALKAVTYAYTASWIAAIIGLVPGLGLLAALAGLIYGLYLLNVGLPFTMKCPPEKSVGYTVVTVIVAIIVSIVLGLVVRSIGGFGVLGGGAATGMFPSQTPGSSVFSSHSSTGIGGSDYEKRMDEASRQLQNAQKSGDAAAKANALGQFMGAAMGSGGKVESLPPDLIKTFLPQTLDGLQRTQQAVERNGAIGMQISKATATYSDGANRTVQLEIVDAGSLKGMVGFASSWAGVEQESQTDCCYDKTYKSAGQLVHEHWDKNAKSGEYSTFVAERFSIKVSGRAADIDELKHAAGGVNASGLAALKDSGVQAN
jgi:Yip1 domain